MKRLIVVLTAVGVLLSLLSASSSMLQTTNGGTAGEAEFIAPLPATPPRGLSLEVEPGITTAGRFAIAIAPAVEVSWLENDPDEDVTLYRIYRAGDNDGDFTRIGSTGRVSYTDNDVQPGETYVYYVTAVNEVGESAPSDEASASLPVDCEALEGSDDYDAAVEDGDCPELTPTPTPTQEGEALDAEGTPGLTMTPEPTSTPQPTPTGTPFPTRTATPETTPAATATTTPQPTDTPQSSPTLQPTASPQPTATQAPDPTQTEAP